MNKNLRNIRKIAIVYDILLTYGGAEKVLENLLKIYPDADIYTFIFNKRDKTIYNKFSKTNPKTSFIQRFQWLGKYDFLLSILKPLALFYFWFLNLSKYDLVISLSGSYNSKLLKKINGTHICYLLTPPKYLYKEKNEFDFIKIFPFNIIFYPFISALRKIDCLASKSPDEIIAISKVVQERVLAYYKRKSTVIYPPVHMTIKKIVKKTKKYYVFHSRLVRNKGVELVIRTASKYKLPLIVIGDGYLIKRMKKKAGKTIKFLGFVDDKKLPNIYSHAKALIYASTDEDFGIVPVEAMSYGVPVIAFKSGGVKETLISKKTGVFFNIFTIKGLIDAIEKFEKYKFNSKFIQKYSTYFSEINFRKRIYNAINQSVIKRI